MKKQIKTRLAQLVEFREYTSKSAGIDLTIDALWVEDIPLKVNYFRTWRGGYKTSYTPSYDYIIPFKKWLDLIGSDWVRVNYEKE